MKTWKLWKRDMNLGIAKRWYVLLLSPIIMTGMAYEGYRVINMLKESELMFSDGTVLDYILYALRGMSVYHFDVKEKFQIPVYWFMIQMGISYFIAYYAHKDLAENGRVIFMAAKSRVSWWNSKCLWCCCSVVIYFALTCLTVVCAAKFFGAEWSFDMTMDLFRNVIGTGTEYISLGEAVFLSVVLPVIMSIALCLLQVLLSFVLTPVVSFALMCAQYILAAYYTAWYFPANFTMWIRSSYVDREGLHPLSGCIIAGILIVSVYGIGRAYFEKKDIL